MFHQIFFSPQVKQEAIFTHKRGIYEFPHELPNDLRLRKLENIRKVLRLYTTNSLVPILSVMMSNSSKKISKPKIKRFS